jgi:hypothetical protein
LLNQIKKTGKENQIKKTGKETSSFTQAYLVKIIDKLAAIV